MHDIQIAMFMVPKLDSRCSLAWKVELDVKTGVFDNDYRSHVWVVLKNDTPRGAP